MPRQSRWITLAAIVALTFFSGLPAASAGCGCDKPPPVPAVVRPEATYAGRTVTVFHPSLLVGQTYSVVFTSGVSGASTTVTASAVKARDLADGNYKPQVNAVVPAMPLGPTRIAVVAGGKTLLSVDDSALTVVPQPIIVPTSAGELHTTGFKAAVSRAGVVYVSLDLSQVKDPLVFRAQLKGVPLRFKAADAVFWNTDGFQMQLLKQSMPGLSSIDSASGTTDSDTLQYSRHEFNTYYLQHFERQPHQLDPNDPRWHTDGTPHVDHDHLVLALAGKLEGSELPAAGSTAQADLVLQTFSLFRQGLVGASSITLTDQSRTDSYRHTDGSWGADGDVLSNGYVSLSGSATVNGDATAAKIDIQDAARVTGTRLIIKKSVPLMPVVVPDGLTELGALTLDGAVSQTLVGPASYHASQLTVRNFATLTIDNSKGPVTIYVDGAVDISNFGLVTTVDLNPEKFALYVGGSNLVYLAGLSAFYGVVYAPDSLVDLSGVGQLYGAVVGDAIQLGGYAAIHYDADLTGKGTAATMISTESATATSTLSSGVTKTTSKTSK